MNEALKTPENKVPGCLSTVYVHATSKDGKIYFQGDSDAQLTKGLVALLVEGLSGNTAQDIRQVRPDFITYAGISASLTPGRNSGFLNMLKLMRNKAIQLDEELSSSSSSSSDSPIYDTIMSKLSLLKPEVLEVVNDSARHAGHAAMKGLSSGDKSETHFKVKIVAACFEGLSLVQRHKMIYTLLDKEMKREGGIHALSLDTKTPSEVANK